MTTEIVFGVWLRAERRARGFSNAAEFARALGKHRSYVDQLENNSINPSSGKPLRASIEACDKIAEVLGLSRALVRSKAGYGVDEPSPVVAQEVEAVEILRSLKPHVRTHAMASLQAFRLLSAADQNSGANKGKASKKRRIPRRIKEPAQGLNVPTSDSPPQEVQNGQEDNGAKKRIGKK